MIRRTTLAAEADDLVVLKEEARRRGLSLAELLAEFLHREADAIRASRRPRIGVIERPVSIARAMEEDADAAARSEFRSQ